MNKILIHMSIYSSSVCILYDFVFHSLILTNGYSTSTPTWHCSHSSCHLTCSYRSTHCRPTQISFPTQMNSALVVTILFINNSMGKTCSREELTAPAVGVSSVCTDWSITVTRSVGQGHYRKTTAGPEGFLLCIEISESAAKQKHNANPVAFESPQFNCELQTKKYDSYQTRIIFWAPFNLQPASALPSPLYSEAHDSALLSSHPFYLEAQRSSSNDGEPSAHVNKNKAKNHRVHFCFCYIHHPLPSPLFTIRKINAIHPLLMGD